MSFETKYLIRWGIPGWMLIFWIGAYFVLTETDYISAHLKFSGLEKLIGVFISLSNIWRGSRLYNSSSYTL